MLFVVPPPACGQNRGIIAGMTNLQLALSIGIPSLLVLVGIFLNNARFGAIDNRFTAMDARMDNRFTAIDGRLDRMQADLSQFYIILGRHEADINNLKEQRRSA